MIRAVLYALAAGIAVVFTFALHEGTHWLAGELLGNRMGMNLNAAWPLSGDYAASWHKPYVDAAGPAITTLQAIVAYAIFRRTHSRWIYPFLLTPAIMRILAGVMNVIHPNDEGRLSRTFGLGLWTLPLLVAATLLYLVIRASRPERYGWRFHTISVILVIAFSSAVILLSQK